MNPMQKLMMRQQMGQPVEPHKKSPFPQPAPYPQPKPRSGMGEVEDAGASTIILVPVYGDGPYTNPDFGWLRLLTGQGELNALGELGLDFDINDPYFGLGPPPVMPAVGGGTNWTKYLQSAGIFWSQVLGKWLINKSGGGTTAIGTGTVLTNEQVAAIIAAERAKDDSGIGIGVDSKGIRLSDGSHISWLLIAGGAVAWKMIQSPGFSRRPR
ncbi:MAG TPA: hypothetical protein VGC87_23220 [Pyrinomonadaceae bacterium]|jgi:hypothetical protein